MYHTLVFLPCLVRSKVALVDVLLMLLAFVFHLLREALTQHLQVRRFTTFLLQCTLELLHALLGDLQSLFDSLAICNDGGLGLLRVCERTTSYENGMMSRTQVEDTELHTERLGTSCLRAVDLSLFIALEVLVRLGLVSLDSFLQFWMDSCEATHGRCIARDVPEWMVAVEEDVISSSCRRACRLRLMAMELRVSSLSSKQ